MTRSLLFRVTAPWLIVGLLACGLCWISAWHVYRVQRDLSNLLTHDVASLLAAQEIEIRVRQLRYHSFLYLTDPSPRRLPDIANDEAAFEQAFRSAEEHITSDAERVQLGTIAEGFRRYKEDMDRLRERVKEGASGLNPARVADDHPIRHIVNPCHELFRINQELMTDAASNVASAADQARWIMIVLGIAGPLGGLLAGFGVARGISRSIYRLSVRIKDVAGRLDQDVATVSVSTGADLQALDAHLQRIVSRVEEVGERLQQQQRELVRAEQLISAGRLAASVAHEVRNPLSAIKMLVEAARRPSGSSPLTAEDLDVILGSVTRLEKTVENFLQFARLPRPEKRPCDLVEVVSQSLKLVATRARQQGVRLEQSAPLAPARIVADPGQITTVLINLLLNALDAMPEGGVLTVVTKRDGVSGHVEILVRDTGTGISEEVLNKLFTPFNSSKIAGTGLGLSIAKQIVEDHGGTLEGRNLPGHGAEFIIRLPDQDAVK